MATINELKKIYSNNKFHELNSGELAFYVGNLRGYTKISKERLDDLMRRVDRCYKAEAYDLISTFTEEIAKVSKELDLATRLHTEYEIRYKAVYAATHGKLPTEIYEKEEVGA